MNTVAQMLEGIMSTQKEGEWTSATINITAGPKEAPSAFIALLPGTTEANAKRIQELFVKFGAEANKSAPKA